MQSQLFAKEVLKMGAPGSILESFWGHCGALCTPNGTPEAICLKTKKNDAARLSHEALGSNHTNFILAVSTLIPSLQ